MMNIALIDSHEQHERQPLHARHQCDDDDDGDDENILVNVFIIIIKPLVKGERKSSHSRANDHQPRGFTRGW